jgi:cytoskeleton protein RodZ
VTPIEQDPPAPPVVTNPDSPGRALQLARESRNLDINYAATALRLSPQVVESIERDDYSRLPSAVFVSGYIRSYARLLGIDPEPLNQKFRQLHPEAEAPPRHFARPEQDLKGGDGSNPALYLVTALIVLALAAAAYVWWSNRPQGEPAADAPLSLEPTNPIDATADSASSVGDTSPLPANSPPAGLPQATPGTDASEQPSQESGAASVASTGAPPESEPSWVRTSTPAETTSVQETSVDAERGPAAEPTIETAAAPAPDDVTAPTPSADAIAEPDQPIDDTGQSAGETATTGDEPAPTPASDGVSLSFSGPCWVDIRDATGSVLLFGEMARGDQETLDGEPPYSLVIGNAAAVEMTVGGTPYDVRAVARGNVARFDIDPRNLDSDADTTAAETTD